MKITESVALGDARVNDRGYLEANARTARTGIQTYLGSEMGRPDLKTVNVYRDEAEVFSKASLHSFSKIPITLDHPPESVTADNWSKHAKGTTGDEVLRDGEYLKIGLKITDADAVRAISDGKRQLSVGYAADIVWEDGVAPDGTAYQARQTNIVADHIAIVQRGRAGSECRIGDSEPHNWGASPLLLEDRKDPPMGDNPLKTVTYDGITIETTDQGAQVIDALLKKLAASEAKVADLERKLPNPASAAFANSGPSHNDNQPQQVRDIAYQSFVDSLNGVEPQKGA